MRYLPSAVFGAAALLFLTFGARAAQPIQGYKCMALNLTLAQMADNSVNVPILSEPKAGAAHVANATPVVLVKSPVHDIDGFDEVLRLNGQTGWLPRSSLMVWRSPDGSSERCIPARMPTGRYGFVTQK